MKSYAVLLSIKLTFILSATAQIVVISSPVFNGNSLASLPFLIEEAGLRSIRYQQVYGATDFASIANGGGYITHLSLSYGGGQSINKIVTNIQINLSTTQKQPDGLSLAFSENVGPDDSLVFGPSMLALNFSSPVSGAVVIPLSTPFFYSPAGGNLLLDVRNFTGAKPDIPVPPNHPGQVDAEDTFSDSVSCVYSLDVDSPVAFESSTLGLVTRFAITPIPEPGTVPLCLGGLAVIALNCYRRQRCSGNSRATHDKLKERP